MSAQIKIAYALVCYDATHSGVYKKILDQVSSWRSFGHSVQLFVITDRKSLIKWQEIDQSVIALFDGSFATNLMNRVKLLRLAAQAHPSIIYLRDSFPMFLPKKSAPIAVEIQSLVGQELKLRSRAKYLVFKILKESLYSRVSGAIYVTNELLHKNEFHISFKVPRVAIGNGVNFDRITALSPRPAVKPSLFFVGSPNQPWHGVKELVEFAKLNPDIDIEVVGDIAESSSPNIKFHGFLSHEDYRSVATKCIAGVGSLNLSVNNMTEASPLKVREYLALGLPVILKYKDVDLDSSADFVLQLPSDGRQLSDFSFEVRSFLDYWSNKRVLPSQVNNLEVSVKEEIRLGFFKRIIDLYVNENIKGDLSEYKN